MVKNGGKYEPMDLQRLIELSNKASVWHISFHLPTGCNIFVVIYILNHKKFESEVGSLASEFGSGSSVVLSA